MTARAVLSWPRRALTAALMALAVGAPWSAAQAESPSVLSAPEAHAAALAGAIALVDVRHPQEWRASGLPEGATPISIHDPAFLEKIGAFIAANPDKPIALICAHGNRSTAAFDALKRLGVTALRNVHEGMNGSSSGAGWIARGLPRTAWSE